MTARLITLMMMLALVAAALAPLAQAGSRVP